MIKKILFISGLLLILFMNTQCTDLVKNAVDKVEKNVRNTGGDSSGDVMTDTKNVRNTGGDSSENVMTDTKNVRNTGGDSSVEAVDDVIVDFSDEYGYGHFTFRYFYYPADKSIYYSSENDIYKVGLDGKNPKKIQDNTQQSTTNNKYKLQHIYVFDDVIYYNDAVSNNTRIVGIAGGDDELKISGSSGSMRMYASGETLYFHDNTKYIKNDVLYYHKGSVELFKKDPFNTGKETEILTGQGENFFFAPDGIYFQLHAIPPTNSGGRHQSYYKVARVSYDVLSQKRDSRFIGRNNLDILMKNIATGVVYVTDDSVDFRDVSEHAIAYFVRVNFGRRHLYIFNRVTKKATRLVGSYPGDGAIRYDATLEQKLIAGRSRAIGAIRIIGEWVYYMIDDTTNKKYTLYRVPINAAKTYDYRHNSTKVIDMRY